MSAPELWAWAPHEDSEEWEGPFATRAEAEARGHAYAACDEDDEYQDGHVRGHVSCGDYFCAVALGVVSRAEWIDRDEIVRGRAELVAEGILEELCGESTRDPETFQAKPGAELALADALAAWAAQYITGSAWQVTGDCEPVTMPERCGQEVATQSNGGGYGGCAALRPCPIHEPGTLPTACVVLVLYPPPTRWMHACGATRPCSVHEPVTLPTEPTPAPVKAPCSHVWALLDTCYGMTGGDLYVCHGCGSRSVTRPYARPLDGPTLPTEPAK